MRKILITQVYNANKGNASVVTAMLDSFDDEWRKNVTFSTYDPQKATQDYGLPACNMLLDPRDVKLQKGFRKVCAIFCELAFLCYFPLWYVARRLYIPLPLFGKKKRRTIRFYQQADVVVLPDGHSYTSLNGVFTNLSHFIAMFTARALRKKTMIYGQTLGPFHGFAGKFEQFFLRRLLPRMDAVTVRDRQSFDAYGKCSPKIHQTAEIVFLMKRRAQTTACAEFIESVRKRQRKIFSVTIHHLYYRYYFSEEQYVSLMADCIKNAALKYDLNVVMVPMEDAVHHGGDRGIIEKIRARMALPEDRFFMPEMELSPEDTAELIASSDFFTGTKTHSVIYGLRGATPMIGIAYQKKTREFMQMFDDEKYAIDLGDLDVERFGALFDELVREEQSVKELLQRRLEDVCAKAAENNLYLRRLLDEK